MQASYQVIYGLRDRQYRFGDDIDIIRGGWLDARSQMSE